MGSRDRPKTDHPETDFFERIERHAAERPHAVALEAPGRRPLSYEGLHEQLREVEVRLRRAGVRSGDRVALVLPPGPEAATASLGVIAAAVAAPLNPELRRAECESLLDRLHPELLITLAGLATPAAEAARAAGIPVAELAPRRQDEAGRFELTIPEVAARPRERLELGAALESGLMLLTSGTSARPKLVPLSRANLSASVANLCASLELEPRDACLHALPMFHVGGLVDVLAAPLAAGGSVICTAGFSVPELLRGLREHRPTWTQLVPTMMDELLRHAAELAEPIRSAGLRLVRSVSAPLPLPLLERFEREFEVPVIEIYGMTETAGLIAANPLRKEDRKPGSVGVAARGVEVAVVDSAGAALPAGESGEVVVRGANVMRGYAGPQDDAPAFFGDRLRSGDLGYLDGDGHLFLQGRIKEIVNRGGEKISPQEVDTVAATHPAVADCATFAVPHPTLGEEPAIAVVRAAGTPLTREELIAWLEPELAYFKVPRIVHFVDELPRSRGGKLQRRRLAEELAGVGPEAARPAPADDAAPVSPIALAFVEMWRDVLDVEAVGVHDDFFELGGDSLRAASFVNALQRRWGEIVYVSALFDAPTVARFQAYVERDCPQLAAKILGEHLRPVERDAGVRIDAETLAEFRRSIVGLAGDAAQAPSRKNPSAVFVLGTPRSGSTLLRALLGGSSRLFAPPELFLLSFDDLAAREAWFQGSQRFLLEGNLRMLMQLRGVGLAAAQRLSASLTARRTPVAEYYGMVQDWLGDRLLVDKTPFYAAHAETLARAERDFAEPRFVHLVRHPYGMIRSFEEAKLEQLWWPRLVGVEAARARPNPYPSRTFAELVWITLHRNILAFLRDVPPARRLRVRFEDLVRSPREELLRVSGFLGIALEPAMLDPHADAAGRMTDGIYPVSRMIGDMKFHQHRAIDPATADTWKRAYATDFLSDAGWELAAELGYDETVAAAQDREEFVI